MKPSAIDNELRTAAEAALKHGMSCRETIAALKRMLVSVAMERDGKGVIAAARLGIKPSALSRIANGQRCAS